MVYYRDWRLKSLVGPEEWDAIVVSVDRRRNLLSSRTIVCRLEKARRAINPLGCIACFPRWLVEKDENAETCSPVRCVFHSASFDGLQYVLSGSFRIEPGLNEDHPLCLYRAPRASFRLRLSDSSLSNLARVYVPV